MNRLRLTVTPFGPQVGPPTDRRDEMGSIAKIRVFPGSDSQWYYETKAANGETLSTSEGYTRKADAVRAAHDAHPDVGVEIEEPFLQ